MTMLEKAARALCEALGDDWDREGVGLLGAYVPLVRAVLAAIREPDVAQLAAAQTAWLNDPEKKSSTIYTAMIDAILEGESK